MEARVETSFSREVAEQPILSGVRKRCEYVLAEQPGSSKELTGPELVCSPVLSPSVTVEQDPPEQTMGFRESCVMGLT